MLLKGFSAINYAKYALKQVDSHPVLKLYSKTTCPQTNRVGQIRYLHDKYFSPNDGWKSTVMYVAGIGILCMGASYAAVPLYRMFCQTSGFGGTTKASHDSSKVKNLKPLSNRLITVKFNADINSNLQWHFKPLQKKVIVRPGETALAFFSARNPTNKPVIGVSTYNIVPFEAGSYFVKIQCFCFDEQMLNPNEQVDMPVFFYIDPEYAEDPALENVDELVLSYTFFQSKPGLKLLRPYENQ